MVHLTHPGTGMALPTSHLTIGTASKGARCRRVPPIASSPPTCTVKHCGPMTNRSQPIGTEGSNLYMYGM